MTGLRVVVVDDDVPTRIGLRTILDAEPDITVVGEADDGLEACALMATTTPDVVLMDVRMRNLDG
ncbi:MAG TPA: response regulator, partial [Acidimicrobiia bacterium]|nr:response regulator [Acidimicrobiia bacterium]